MSNFLITDTLLTQIANAIRTKDGTSAGITVSNFPARILAIPSSGGDLTVADTKFIDAVSSIIYNVVAGENHIFIIAASGSNTVPINSVTASSGITITRSTVSNSKLGTSSVFSTNILLLHMIVNSSGSGTVTHSFVSRGSWAASGVLLSTHVE